MSGSKQTTARQSILNYFIRQNRPYSVQDVFMNAGKDFGKTAVAKVIDALVTEGKLKEKVYGKQKVYVANQDQFPSVSESELKALDESIVSMNEKVKALTEENRKFETDIKKFNDMPTTEEANQSIIQISSEIANLEQKLTKLRNGQVLVSKEEKDKLYTNRTKFVKEWRKRKRITTDIINGILEGYPKSKKQLLEEIGIETDEEYNVKPPEL